MTSVLLDREVLTGAGSIWPEYTDRINGAFFTLHLQIQPLFPEESTQNLVFSSGQ